MKRIANLGIAAAYLLVGGMILAMAANAFASAQERTQLYRYFSEALDPIEAHDASVSWVPAGTPLARPFTEADEGLVGRALGDAWRAYAVAMSSGETELLQDYYSGVALQRAGAAAAAAHRSGTRLALLDQTVAPTFYHLDGSVLQVETEALSVRFAMDADRLSYFEVSRDRLRTTLMNETTGLRIFSHEMTGMRAVEERARPTRHPGPLAGINYYPARTPWRKFWPEFDPAIIDRDLRLISDLGANSVRIFLPTQDFAKAQGDEPLQHLEAFLRLAREHDLKVVPTLFDMNPGYDPTMWSASAAYLHRVLPVLSRSDAVAFVDLKNEPDLDVKRYGPALIEAWVRAMSALCREIAPDLLLSVGWADAEPAARYAGLVDVVSYHDYAPIEGTAERLSQVKRAAGNKPVYVTEIGSSSYQLALGFPGSPLAQGRDIADRFSALDSANGVFVWTLHDFEAPDAAAVGRSPWVKKLQSEFGLIDSSGQPKPAAAAVEAAFEAILLGGG